MRFATLLAYSAIFFTVAAHAALYDFYPATGATAETKKPILIFVHGGAWVGGAAEDYRSLAEALTSRGLCVAAVNYRLAPEYEHPAPVEDLNAAIHRIEKSAPAGCDPGKLFLSGHSAGAHLIAFWATRYSQPAVAGFIGLEGIYDIPALIRKWPAYRDQFITAEFGKPSAWKAASPALLPFKSRAPWLVIHTKEDELVDVEQSSGFERHLKKIGVPAEIAVLPSGSHFGVVTALQDKASAASALLMRFIETRASAGQP